MKIHNLEQRTPEWFALRLGKPTASNFKLLITSTGKPSKSIDRYAAQLAGEAYAGTKLDDWEGNQWTERGSELEEAAKAEYSLMTGDSVIVPGFVTNDSEEFGCSPDGFVGENLVEIKTLKPDNHVITVTKEYKNCPADYKAQVMGQIYICEMDYCDLFFYNPMLPNRTIRVHRDQKFIDALVDQIEICLQLKEEYFQKLKKI